MYCFNFILVIKSHAVRKKKNPLTIYFHFSSEAISIPIFNNFVYPSTNSTDNSNM